MEKGAKLVWHGVSSRYLGLQPRRIGLLVIQLLFLYSAILNRLQQEFNELPGAKSVVFNIVPAVPLSPLLPNLPPSYVLHSATTSTNDNASSEKPTNLVLNLLQQFLLYPPGLRIRAKDALHHPWFTSQDSIILLPKGYSLENEYHHVKTVDEWQGKSLEEWLPLIVPLSSV